jgi:hypothetical protein
MLKRRAILPGFLLYIALMKLKQHDKNCIMSKQSSTHRGKRYREERTKGIERERGDPL